jgi:hypothetical protein
MGSVVTEAYRTLEHFLMTECKRNIRVLNKFEMNSLYKVLCNCRILMPHEECLSFLKFVRIAYALSNVAVTE